MEPQSVSAVTPAPAPTKKKGRFRKICCWKCGKDKRGCKYDRKRLSNETQWKRGKRCDRCQELVRKRLEKRGPQPFPVPLDKFEWYCGAVRVRKSRGGVIQNPVTEYYGGRIIGFRSNDLIAPRTFPAASKGLCSNSQSTLAEDPSHSANNESAESSGPSSQFSEQQTPTVGRNFERGSELSSPVSNDSDNSQQISGCNDIIENTEALQPQTLSEDMEVDAPSPSVSELASSQSHTGIPSDDGYEISEKWKGKQRANPIPAESPEAGVDSPGSASSSQVPRTSGNQEIATRSCNAMLREIKQLETTVVSFRARIQTYSENAKHENRIRDTSKTLECINNLLVGLETFLASQEHKASKGFKYNLMLSGSQYMADVARKLHYRVENSFLRKTINIPREERQSSSEGSIAGTIVSSVVHTDRRQDERGDGSGPGANLEEHADLAIPGPGTPTQARPAPSPERLYGEWGEIYMFPGFPDNWGNHGLHLTAYYGYTKKFNEILCDSSNWKEKVEMPNYAGETSLMIASEKGRKAFVVGLIHTLGAHPDGRDPEQISTPLHRAVQFGHLEVVSVLLQNGADKHARGRNDGESSYELAQTGEHIDPDIRALLGCTGASVLDSNFNQWGGQVVFNTYVNSGDTGVLDVSQS